MPGLKRAGSMAKNRKYKKKSRRGSQQNLTVVRSFPTRFKYSTARWQANPNIGLSLPLNTPVSRVLKTKMTYFERTSLDPTTGGIADDKVFRLNSLYDPNATLVGHQPAGFDELMALYKYYAVVAADVHVTFQSADTNNEALCLAHVNTTSTALTSCQAAIENGRSCFQVLGKYGSSRDITEMRLSVSIPTETGVGDVMDSPDLWGTQSLDPTNVVYLHLTAQPNSSVDAGIIGLYVSITFTAMFFEPRTVASS